VHSTEEEVRSNLNSDSGVVLTAPVVGMPFYSSLAAAAVGCGVSGATCDTILDLFVNYFQDALAAIGSQLSDYIETQLVDGMIKAVLQPARSLQEAVQGLPEKVQDAMDRCSGSASEAAVEAKEAVSSAVSDLEGSLDSLGTFLKDAEELFEVREAALPE
jgi:uncharacterized protein YukE